MKNVAMPIDDFIAPKPLAASSSESDHSRSSVVDNAFCRVSVASFLETFSVLQRQVVKIGEWVEPLLEWSQLYYKNAMLCQQFEEKLIWTLTYSCNKGCLFADNRPRLLTYHGTVAYCYLNGKQYDFCCSCSSESMQHSNHYCCKIVPTFWTHIGQILLS